MNNYNGVKLGKQKTDFIAGANSPLKDEIINDSGNWDEYRPIHELQNRGYETYACLIFSGLDCVETLFMYYLKNNLIPAEYVKWLGDNGYFEDGFINFSDRLPAQFADIKIGIGTYQYKANDAIRKYLVPESMMKYDKNNYYNEKAITEKMLWMAEQFNERFTINWQWEENTSNVLKKSPLQAIVKYANGDEILKPDGKLNHGIEVYKEDQESYHIDDSYSQRDKRYDKDYIKNFVSYTLTINYKNMFDASKFISENDLKFVRNTNTGEFGRIMREKLRTIKTSDRGALILLDNEHRKNGVSITNEEWKKLPKEDF